MTNDANGNLKYWGTGDGWQRLLSYDDENRLVNVEVPGYYVGSYSYDALGRLRVRSEQGWNGWVYSWSRYLYDGMMVVQERDGSNVPTVSYTRGKDLSGSLEGAGGIGGMLARSHGYSAGSWSTHSYYHADGMGNITRMVNSTNGVVASYKYDAYGRTINSSGSLAGPNVYRFSSKMWIYDGTPGYYYFGYRFYEPSLQRWLNRDPLEETGGINLYSVTENSPTLNIDPDGRQAWRCRRALGKKSGTPPPKRGPLFHEYYCVQMPGSPIIKCYGQSKEAKFPWNSGRPTTPEEDSFAPNLCDPIGGGSFCLDRCLTRKGKEKRPYYGLIGPGTNCKEWAADTIAACQKECPEQCNGAFSSTYHY